jgi:GAF domain-containing protein
MISLPVMDLFDSERVLLVVNICFTSDQKFISPLSISEVERLTRFWAQSLSTLISMRDQAVRDAVARVAPRAAGAAALFDMVLPIVQSATHAQFAALLLWNESDKVLESERSNNSALVADLPTGAIYKTCVGDRQPFFLVDEASSSEELGIHCQMMAVPIFSSFGRVSAVLVCSEPRAEPAVVSFSSLDLRALLTLASLVSPSLERLVRLRKESRLDQAVREIVTRLASAFKIQDVLDSAITTLVRLTNAGAGSIYLLEGETLTMRAAVGVNRELLNKAKYKIGEGLTGTIAQGGALTFRSHQEVLASHPDSARYDTDIYRDDRISESFLGIPIRLRGHTLGVMEVANKRPTEDAAGPYFTDEDLQLASVVASFLGYALESVRVEDEKIRAFRTLAHSTIRIASARSVDDAIATVLSSLQEGGYDRAILSLVNKTNEVLEGVTSLGKRWLNLEAMVRYPLTGDDILVRTLQQNESLFIPDSRLDLRCDQRLVSAGNIVAQYIMPLRLGDELIGTLQVGLGLRREIPEDISLTLQGFAGHLAVAISRVRSVDALLEMTNQVLSSSRFIVAETLSSMAVHSVHHQIRKIMADLKRDLGRREIKEREFLKDTLTGWERDLGRLETDLENALSFVRADRESTEEVADLHREIQRSLDFWITSLNQAKCIVEKKLLATEYACRLPPQACQEIVSVLVVNAIQAHAKKITLETQNSSNVRLGEKVIIRHAVCLDFVDNGIGLVTNTPDEVFEPTYSTKPDKFGTGLGLFIARQLARRAGGELRVRTDHARSKGAAFSLVLPVAGRMTQ